MNMKLKILPPTLRINNRYLVLDIKSELKISKDELVSAIWYACLRLYGEIGTSDFNLWLMKFYDISNYSSNHYKIDNNINNSDIDTDINNNSNNNNNKVNTNSINNFINYEEEEPSYYHFKVVLRCKRGCEEKVRGSLALLSNYNNKKIAITTIGISGTISSSIEKFIK
ncbi:hypothetical protein MARBORIA2_04860 [Methanobrevibacter arboriphilus]|uniref:Uncharacterized protein n=1 Tax=Methanobrevibacter arboriphilus TaxID=39441 RepID=A0ACA8R184_METAZ|nr:hypothetical protein MarbSA_03100 [Methanobrevibacter arboriphilus]GLI11396.1 hypothetical protein MARBORIA2_04860 [Methanobrevibacter arboriphilus]